MSGTRCVSQALRGVLLLSLLLNVGGLLALTEHSTIPSVFGAQSYVIDKPWEPLFIGNGTIPAGDKMVVTCTLQAGKRYHVFLVGDYVNEANPQTDYDIFVYPPSGPQTTHTEATGMPEQVANDAAHQFYVARSSGTYRFEIHNDPEDTKNGMDEPAVFMVIEHIDTDKRLSTSLMGRLLPSDPQNPASTWACEFTTPASNFTVYVDTPDAIDMFEARVYPMANPGTTGYEIWGVPTPNGDLLNGTVEGSYGGFNTTIGGYRPASLTASCEHMGEKMKINVSGLGSSNSTSASLGVSYFLVLIAEYSRGGPSAVPFYIRTDTTKPVINMTSPGGRVYAERIVEFGCNVSSPRSIDRVWLDFTVNGKPTVYSYKLSPEEGHYSVDVPSFMGGDMVNYTVYAEDEIGNVGNFTSNFLAKRESVVECTLSKPSYSAGDKVEVSGTSSLGGKKIRLDYTTKTKVQSFEVETDNLGSFSHAFEPKETGDWEVQAVFKGDGEDHEAKSPSVRFNVAPIKRVVTCDVGGVEAKKGKPLTVTGRVAPGVGGVPVEVIFSSSSGYLAQNVVTSSDGSYSASVTLEETGPWEILARAGGDWRYLSSSSPLSKIEVIPLTPIELAFVVLATMAMPPYVYAVSLAAVLVAGVVVWRKWGFISAHLPKPLLNLASKLLRSSKKGNSKTNGKSGASDRERYRRQE